MAICLRGPRHRARAGGGLGRIGKTGWDLSRGVSTADATPPAFLDDVARRPRPRVGRRRVGVGPSDASDWSDVRWPDTPGSYGSVSSRALAGLPEWRRGGFGIVDPKRNRASPSRRGRGGRRARVVLDACTRSRRSMVSMVRMTSSPGYPSALQGHDDRSVQVGTIANSSEAIGAYRGCEVTAGGAALPTTKARGASRISCWRARRARGGGAGGVLGGEAGGVRGEAEASLRKEGGNTRGNTRHTSPRRVPHGRGDSPRRLGVGFRFFLRVRCRLVALRRAGLAPLDALAERRRRRAFLRGPAVAASAAPLDAQKEYLDAHFHRCGEREAFLSVPRFQNTKDLLYTGWAPLRMCEAMGGDETRVVAMLTNPIDHAASVFAETLLEHRDAVAAGRRRRGGPKKRENISTPGAASSSRWTWTCTSRARAAPTGCSWEPAILGSRRRRGAASAAAEKGSRRGPGAPAGAQPASPRTSARGVTSAAAGLQPARAGAWVDYPRRLYERVPAQNVMVVTADQARRSGLPTLAVAVVGWRLLGLPLVDPVSVSIDLQRARARAAAAAPPPRGSARRAVRAVRGDPGRRGGGAGGEEATRGARGVRRRAPRRLRWRRGRGTPVFATAA